MEPEIHVQFNPHVRGVNPNIWGRARIWSLEHGRTMGSVIDEALEMFLEAKANEPSPARWVPPARTRPRWEPPSQEHTDPPPPER